MNRKAALSTDWVSLGAIPEVNQIPENETFVETHQAFIVNDFLNPSNGSFILFVDIIALLQLHSRLNCDYY